MVKTIPTILSSKVQLALDILNKQMAYHMFTGTSMSSKEALKEIIEDKQWRGVCDYLEKQAQKWLQKGWSTFQFNCSTGRFIWVKDESAFDEALEQYKKEMLGKIEKMQSDISDQLYGREY